MEIRKEDFADEKSRRIFEHRLKFCTTGNMEHILDMVMEEYYDFASRIEVLKKNICTELKAFDGKLVIYGTGVHGGLTMDFLKRIGIDDKVACYCVSSAGNCVECGGKTVKQVDDLCSEKKNYKILVPDGDYALEMIDNLEFKGWKSHQYILIPYAILFDNGWDEKKQTTKKIREIFNNRNNHFIVYGTDWNSILFRTLIRGAHCHFDFSIAECGGGYRRFELCGIHTGCVCSGV